MVTILTVMSLKSFMWVEFLSAFFLPLLCLSVRSCRQMLSLHVVNLDEYDITDLCPVFNLIKWRENKRSVLSIEQILSSLFCKQC